MIENIGRRAIFLAVQYTRISPAAEIPTIQKLPKINAHNDPGH
jgi:hypothetical protein